MFTLVMAMPVFSVTDEENTNSDTSTIYGGQSGILYEYNLDEICQRVTVNVTSELEIHSTPDGVREYYLEGCILNKTAYVENDYNDLWHCNCTDGEFDLELSTLINAVNSYNFTIKFYVEEEEQDETIGGGGGGSLITTTVEEEEECIPDWSCTRWSLCFSDGTRTRNCIDLNRCGDTEDKPDETMLCEPPEVDDTFEEVVVSHEDEEPVIEPEEEAVILDEEDEEEPPTSPIVGAFFGLGEDGALWVLFIVLIAGLVLYITLRENSKRNPKFSLFFCL